MDMPEVQIVAGLASSMIFAGGTLSMLEKTWRTKNVESFSIVQLVLSNIGNLVYWLYVASLPFGPIWLMHGFYTIATMLMLIWSILYRHAPETFELATLTLKRLTTRYNAIQTEVTQKPTRYDTPSRRTGVFPAVQISSRTCG